MPFPPITADTMKAAKAWAESLAAGPLAHNAPVVPPCTLREIVVIDDLDPYGLTLRATDPIEVQALCHLDPKRTGVIRFSERCPDREEWVECGAQQRLLVADAYRRGRDDQGDEVVGLADQLRGQQVRNGVIELFRLTLRLGAVEAQARACLVASEEHEPPILTMPEGMGDCIGPFAIGLEFMHIGNNLARIVQDLSFAAMATESVTGLSYQPLDPSLAIGRAVERLRVKYNRLFGVALRMRKIEVKGKGYKNLPDPTNGDLLVALRHGDSKVLQSKALPYNQSKASPYKPVHRRAAPGFVNYCFPGDTYLQLADGSPITFAELEVLDGRAEPLPWLASFDTSTQQVFYQQPRAVRTHAGVTAPMLELRLRPAVDRAAPADLPLRVTPNHPILVQRAGTQTWVPAGELQTADRLVGPDGLTWSIDLTASRHTVSAELLFYPVFSDTTQQESAYLVSPDGRTWLIAHDKDL